MRGLSWLLGVCWLGVTGLASAEQAPAERVGFQMAVRTGYAQPLGYVGDGLPLDDVVSGHIPLFVELGAKVSQHVFIGGYLGASFGGTSGVVEQFCEQDVENCSTGGARLGVEVQYHLLPRGPLNPWLGYGIGLESVALRFEDQGRDSSVTYSGFEYARFSSGLDFRLTKAFGIGPFLDLAVGEYTRVERDTSGDDGNRDMDDRVHGWLTLGVRVVVFP